MPGLTTLLNGWHWVFVRLRQAQITTLADLIAADALRLKVHINADYSRHKLLITYDHDETAYLKTFAIGFPPISDVPPPLSLRVKRRKAIDQRAVNP